MEFDDVINARRSIRTFQKKPITLEEVYAAVDAAAKAPFAGNLNNLRFIITENPAKIEKIASACNQPWIAEAPVVAVLVSDPRHLESLYGDRGLIYTRQQAGAMIENFLLKLTEMHLGACWVGAFTEGIIKQLTRMFEYLQVEAVIPIGYPGEELAPPPESRKRWVEHEVYWEVWQKKRHPHLHRDYMKDEMALM